LPHSEIGRSKLACSSLPRIVAWHVLHRHTAPRHSPDALRIFRPIFTPHTHSVRPPRLPLGGKYKTSKSYSTARLKEPIAREEISSPSPKGEPAKPVCFTLLERSLKQTEVILPSPKGKHGVSTLNPQTDRKERSTVRTNCEQGFVCYFVFAISFLSERSKAHVFVDASFTHQFCTLHVYSFVKVRGLQKTIARLLKKTGILRCLGEIAHSAAVQIYPRFARSDDTV